jgi:hypothetical protein
MPAPGATPGGGNGAFGGSAATAGTVTSGHVGGGGGGGGVIRLRLPGGPAGIGSGTVTPTVVP